MEHGGYCQHRSGTTPVETTRGADDIEFYHHPRWKLFLPAPIEQVGANKHMSTVSGWHLMVLSDTLPRLQR